MIRPVSALPFNAAAVRAQTAQLGSFEAFRRAAVVMRHARCMNCHIPVDQPLNGAAGEPHPMLVKRGSDGLGTRALRCTTCHEETNGELPHSPPGAKDWKLPPPETRIAWVGLKDQKPCSAILSTRVNGGLARDKIVHHMDSDPRILWLGSQVPDAKRPPWIVTSSLGLANEVSLNAWIRIAPDDMVTLIASQSGNGTRGRNDIARDSRRRIVRRLEESPAGAVWC